MATPYIGSKICLISKAEIRYEGILYTIDSKESTVALAKVRAFGTEDRKAETQFPALDEIFEYIIFKAGDIKEIRVCQPPVASVASDPAIVSHSVAPGPPGTPGTGGAGPPGPSFGDFSGTPYAGQTPIFMNPPSFGNGLGIPPASMLSGAGGAPSNEQAPVGYPSKAESSEQREGSRSSSPDNSRHHGDRRRENEGDEQKRHPRNGAPSHYNRGGPGNRDQRDSYQPRDNYQRRNNNGNPGYGPQDGQRNRNPQNRNPNQRGPPRRPANKEPLKFDEEFDFDKANLEFQELESKMAKTKISDGGEEGGETECENNENYEGGEQNEEAKNSSEKENNEDVVSTDEFYSKSKSFFDKISCEALEREKGVGSGRVDWRHERSINKETFGVAAPPNRGYRRNNWSVGYNDYNRGPRGGHYGGGGGQRGNRNGYYNGPRNYGDGQRNYGDSQRHYHDAPRNYNNYGGYGGYGNNRGYDNRNRNNEFPFQGPRNGNGNRAPRPSQQNEA